MKSTILVAMLAMAPAYAADYSSQSMYSHTLSQASASAEATGVGMGIGVGGSATGGYAVGNGGAGGMGGSATGGVATSSSAGGAGGMGGSATGGVATSNSSGGAGGMGGSATGGVATSSSAGGAGGVASSMSGGGQGGSANAAGGQGGNPNAAGGTSSVVYNEAPAAQQRGTVTIKNTPEVTLSNIAPTSPCMGGTSVGGSGPGFSIGIGTTWKDGDCSLRETARSFAGLGLTDDAIAILCSSEYAAAAPSCKALKKD